MMRALSLQQVRRPIHLGFFAVLALLVCVKPAFSRIGATLEECKTEYGKIEFSSEKDGVKIYGFVPKRSPYNGIIVMAMMPEDVVESLIYEDRAKKPIPPDLVEFLVKLNGRSSPLHPIAEINDDTYKAYIADDASVVGVYRLDKGNFMFESKEGVRKLLGALGLTNLTSPPSQQQPIADKEPYPRELWWLGESCAILARESIAEKSPQGRELLAWIDGFFNAMRAGGLMYESASPLFGVPEIWNDRIAVAKSLNSFIRERCQDIPGSAPAQKVMMAWYLVNHPESSFRDKSTAAMILAELSDKDKSEREPTPRGSRSGSVARSSSADSTSAMQPSSDDDPQARIFTAAWLEQCCAEILVVDSEKLRAGQLPARALSRTQSLIVWFDGFFEGVANSGEQIGSPPEEWTNRRILCTKLASFLAENSESIPHEAPASQVMWAFYLLKHPDGTSENRSSGRAILDAIQAQFR